MASKGLLSLKGVGVIHISRHLVGGGGLLSILIVLQRMLRGGGDGFLIARILEICAKS